MTPKLLDDEDHNQILGNNMRGLVQIFAIGGGGFTHSQAGGGCDGLLEDRLLALVGPVAKLKIGYIGHANNDRADRLTAFYARFAGCARTTHLPITADMAMAQDFLQDLNILYVGGGATKEKVSAAFKIILSDKNVKGILINIFGGIMRCDVLAQGVVDAAKEMKINVPLVVRLAGTNFKEGKEILDNSGLKLISAENLDDAAKKIVEAIK